MDMPVNVPVDNPDADTEWNDILRKHGVIPEKPPSPTPVIQEAIAEARKRAHDNRLEDKTLDELDELEDEEDEEFLNKYRSQRLAELSNLSKNSVFNQVFPLQKADYQRDVTDASKEAFVFVHMASSLASNIESTLLSQLWRQVAAKFGDVKFCEIRADLCVENYPEKNTPTILVYKNGDIQRQLITLRELRGERTKLEDIESLLVSIGAVAANDQRVLKAPANTSASARGAMKDGRSDDSDDDWD